MWSLLHYILYCKSTTGVTCTYVLCIIKYRFTIHSIQYRKFKIYCYRNSGTKQSRYLCKPYYCLWSISTATCHLNHIWDYRYTKHVKHVIIQKCQKIFAHRNSRTKPLIENTFENLSQHFLKAEKRFHLVNINHHHSLSYYIP